MERGNGSRVVELCCAILLAVAAVRLFQIDRNLFAQNFAAQARLSRISTRGSLTNLVPAQTAEPKVEADRLLLLFVVHANRADDEMAFWNAVDKQIAREGLDVQVVGVCDQVNSCSGTRNPPSFRVIDLLDPHQGRVLATADASGNALLYRGGSLAAQLRRTQDASAVVSALIDAVKP